jgi:hypothetical protein
MSRFSINRLRQRRSSSPKFAPRIRSLCSAAGCAPGRALARELERAAEEAEEQ